MAQLAPPSPTTLELQGMYPFIPELGARVDLMRNKVSHALGEQGTKLVVIVGPCAMTDDAMIIEREGNRLEDLSITNPDIIPLHRLPPWKPRTNPADWHGLETTQPEVAHGTLVARSMAAANLAIEIGHGSHLSRYGDMLTLGWKGGRNNNNPDLTKAMALHDPNLPILIKNGLDGDITSALEDIKRVEDLRGSVGAAATLLYRGGANAKNPDAWESELLNAFNKTRGNLIIDVAHGGEMAHDPDESFGKSVAGQIICLNHVIALAESGFMPKGIMIESSDAQSPTDPVMPFDIAMQKILQLAEVQR